MDKEIRNKLATTTLAIRRLLEEEFARQLEGTFDIFADGRIGETPAPTLTPEQRFIREKIVASIEHRRSKGESAVESIFAHTRECAFTFLNRLAAFKMMEARGLMQECVSRGLESSGFKEFTGLAPGLGVLPDKGYRLYLECLCDEIGREVGVLFNRFDAASLLWPARRVLEEVLERLNDAALAVVWREDETIGWIYQYYNDPAERKKMRKESDAPRNTRELAVRNQFFTPRYVVEFLTDNTLGRLWYEMTRGKTRLREECPYLIRRSNEIFLATDGSAPPSAQAGSADQPNVIPHRPLKDPRTIQMIDPACGSMHFGLYTFDLFTAIYDEAWDLQEAVGDDASNRFPELKPLRKTYPTKQDFLRDVPRLIVEHNIHGVDIDPRAAQIAGLALWLRAQKEWQRLNVPAAQRPPIRRSNIVCAEPMPGDVDRLKEFCASLRQPVIGQMVAAIFEKMKLAGEAGSLLKIEEEITELVQTTKLQWSDTFRFEEGQDELFAKAEVIAPSRPKTTTQSELPIDFSGVTDEAFWDKAEEHIYSALRAYAEQPEHRGGFERRLFADDAERGFAFIDVCRRRYDVALMNPPFGDASLPSKPYIEETYGDTKGDVYKAFVESFHDRLAPAGYLGILSSRTGFFLGQSEDWRTRVVLRLFRPTALADLGSGVLDAMVEVAAYVLRNLSVAEARDLTLSLVPALETVARDQYDRFSLPKWQAARANLKRHQAAAELEHLAAHGFIKSSPGKIVRYTPIWSAVKKVTAPPSPFYPLLVSFRVLAESDKSAALLRMVQAPAAPGRFISDPANFTGMPATPFAYWVTGKVRQVFDIPEKFETEERTARRGPCTSNDFRLLRVWWETNPSDIRRDKLWVPFAKGGASVRFYSDQTLLVAWEERRFTFQGFFGRPGRWMERLESSDCFFRPGITWPLRAASLSPQVLPSGCVFSARGYAAFAPKEQLAPLLGLMASQPFDFIFKSVLGRFGFPEFVVGMLQQLPLPTLSMADSQCLEESVYRAWRLKREMDSVSLTSHAMFVPALVCQSGLTLTERAIAWSARVSATEESISVIQGRIDELAFRVYGLDVADRAALSATLSTEAECDPDSTTDVDEEEEAAIADASVLAAAMVDYALGCAFGRWDVRASTGARPLPEPTDPFAPLPVCPPGMLQNMAGLPAAPADVPVGYPMRISWSGIVVDDAPHSDDIERRARETFAVLFPERTDAIVEEACTLLRAKSLRDWFRKSTGFFGDHLKRYSKSGRQAPIYWSISSPRGLYTIWLYYHRLTPDTFFTALREFVKPKLEDEERRLFGLKQEAGPSATPSQVRDVAAAEELVEDIRAFRDELQRVAPLWRPNLNDGVIINHALLWRMAPHAGWRKSLKECWDALVAGDYDWAHLAMHLWPERVVPKCATDRSLAIAHGLESFFWEENSEMGKWSPRKRTEAEIAAVVAERTSHAVIAALDSLVNAPAPGGVTSKRAKRHRGG